MTFAAVNPATGESLGTYPVSAWPEVDAALEAGTRAYREIERAGPEACAAFLDRFAERLEASADELVALAHAETALPVAPRLANVELPRTTNQMRQGARAARERSWRSPTISPRERIASYLAPIPGVVCVFGPNNFPFAFNAVSGGDAVAAIATGHPVLAKGHPGHPGTTALLAREALEAAADTDMPAATVQLVFDTADGERMVSDARVGASAFTGSRRGGMTLKAAADRAGKPIYLELSSVNPVVVLPGALRERGQATAAELAASALMGAGQFCTSPGLLFAPDDDGFARALGSALRDAPGGTLLGELVRRNLAASVDALVAAGARVTVSGSAHGVGVTYPNTLLETDARTFLSATVALQTEAFGNAMLLVRYRDPDELDACLVALEGSLTACVYASASDDDLYDRVAPVLRERCGRLLNDKPPTGVAVVAAMHHGGPLPATGHPLFTSVGIPASLERFAMRQSFDNVADHRLPPELRAANPLGMQRLVDGTWTAAPFTWGASAERESRSAR